MHDHRVGKEFFNRDLKALTIKAELTKLNYIKIKTSIHQKIP